MKLFKDYKISEELQKNSFICSLANQYETKELTEKQIQALNDILGIEETLIDVPIVYLTSVRETFFRTDSNGDYLSDSKFAGFKELDDFDLNEKTQDLHALQYGTELYVPKYFYGEVLTLPDTENKYYIVDYFMKEFQFAYDAIRKTKFRSTKRKNKFIRLFNAISGKYGIADELYTELTRRY